MNGDAKSRAEWFSYALTNIAVSVVGTKGVDKVATSVKLPNLKVEKSESQTQTVMQPALAGVPAYGYKRSHTIHLTQTPF
ncbi:hypothetical protein GJU40_20015 [Bacillus lacus]|uniref:Uncharacterized protein n=1 Tax=Metabacillus lacus TaxID=1983721 RepID=A0A7X2M187_9BACI|nr:hypothetical protein [Metabacillus lacus]MRX74407.1 hypothetical protein [Metabacillus lacus]